MEFPKVSIITVNYRQPKVTVELLSSLKKLDYPNLEVILVDNGKTVDFNPFFFQSYPGLKLVSSKKNLGFAGANNLGIKEARGEFLFFLNNDTELENGVIEELLSSFDGKTIGAVSPILRYAEEPSRIQFAGYTPIHSLTGRNAPIRIASSQKSLDSPYFHGAAVMIPRWAIDLSGPMPEEYFLYYEELDWSQRVREAGLKIKVCHTVSVLHKESISTGKNSPLKVYYQTRNRIHFMRRNVKNSWAFVLYFCMISLPKNTIKFSFTGQMKHLKAFQMGWKHALLHKKLGGVSPAEFS